MTDYEDFDFEFEDETKNWPEEKQLGFFFELRSYVKPDFDAAVQKAHELFTTKKWFIDEDDYEWAIQAEAVDKERKRLAWVEWRFKQGSSDYEYNNYYLKARTAAGDFWRWEIETYNPYFGCDVKLLDWLADAVLIIYEDKHDTYAARFNGDGVERIKISSDWKIEDGLLIDEKNSRKFSLENFEAIE